MSGVTGGEWSAQKRQRVEEISSSSSSFSSSSSEDEEGELDSRRYTCRVCLRPDAGAIYICPRCSTRSCSLACVKLHKQRDECSGVRERVKFKAKGALTVEDLRQDLAVISDVSSAVESAARVDSLIALNNAMTPVGAEQFAKTDADGGTVLITKTVKEAIISGAGVVFRQSPPCAARRKRNTTSYRRRKLKWRVEWLVKTADAPEAPPLQLAVRSILETCLLQTALTDALKALGLSSAVAATDYVVMMVDESVPSDQRGYILFDQSKTIHENLRGLVVIDFPTLHAAPKALIKIRSKSTSYKLDPEKLPKWATAVIPTRLEHLYTFEDKP